MNQNNKEGIGEFREIPAIEGDTRIPNQRQEYLINKMTHTSSTEEDLIILESILSNSDSINNMISVYSYSSLDITNSFEKELKEWFDEVYVNFRVFDIEKLDKMFAFVAMEKVFFVVNAHGDVASNATVYAGKEGTQRHIIYNNLSLILNTLFGEEENKL